MQEREAPKLQPKIDMLPTDVLGHIASFLIIKKPSAANKTIPLAETDSQFAVTAINKKFFHLSHALTPPQLRKVCHGKENELHQLQQQIKDSELSISKLKNILERVESEIHNLKVKQECKENDVLFSAISKNFQQDILKLFPQFSMKELSKLTVVSIKEQIYLKYNLQLQQLSPRKLNLMAALQTHSLLFAIKIVNKSVQDFFPAPTYL